MASKIDKKNLIIRFHATLYSHGLADQKEYILADYKVKSTKDLSVEELEQIIRKIDGNRSYLDNDNLRKKIISLFKTVAITDIDKIKAIVKEKWGKEFNNFSKSEYQKIIAVIENRWIPFYLKKLNDGTK